ncbi:MAG: hypothetical protein NVSMB62_24870 [Acidobacteriaceae bacterium]
MLAIGCDATRANVTAKHTSAVTATAARSPGGALAADGSTEPTIQPASVGAAVVYKHCFKSTESGPTHRLAQSPADQHRGSHRKTRAQPPAPMQRAHNPHRSFLQRHTLRV